MDISLIMLQFLFHLTSKGRKRFLIILLEIEMNRNEYTIYTINKSVIFVDYNTLSYEFLGNKIRIF